MTDTPPVATPAKTKTEYVVLKALPRTEATGIDQWEAYDSNVQATSAEDAIKKATSKEGTYVAVPARSFRPVTVTVETVSRLKLEDA